MFTSRGYSAGQILFCCSTYNPRSFYFFLESCPTTGVFFSVILTFLHGTLFYFKKDLSDDGGSVPTYHIIPSSATCHSSNSQPSPGERLAPDTSSFPVNRTQILQRSRTHTPGCADAGIPSSTSPPVPIPPFTNIPITPNNKLTKIPSKRHHKHPQYAHQTDVLFFNLCGKICSFLHHANIPF